MSAMTRPRDATGRFAKRASAAASVSGAQNGSTPPGADTFHRAASQTDSIMQAWNPALIDPNGAWPYEHVSATARVEDLVRNNGFAATAIDQTVAMIVGVDFRYSARHELMAQRLKISVEQASVLASEIEHAWDSFANDKLHRGDWSGQLSFGQQVNLAARHKFTNGEAFAVLRFDKGALSPGWNWRTSLQMIHPARVENPTPMPMSGKIINGVETDGRRVVAYHVRNAHPADRSMFADRFTFEKVPARESWGRPVMIHVRDTNQVGEMRGMSKFLPVLRPFKQLSDYIEKELSSASLNAMFGAYIKTTKTAGEAGEALGVEQLKALGELRSTFYRGANPRLGNGSRIPVLAPGDEFTLNAVPRHVASFQGFVTTMVQSIAAALGLAGSQLTMDFSKTNFSSWRGEMLQVWRGVLRDRSLIASQFCDPVLLAVIEEGIDNGMINPPEGCPDLYECTTGWLAGRWIGPPRGTIDPAGEVDGAVKRISAGLSTHEDEALELGGGDYQAIKGQTAFEDEMWGDTALTPTALREMRGAPQPGAAAPQPENVGKGNVALPAEDSDVQPDVEQTDADASAQ
jgi:lambda family phage portal protein